MNILFILLCATTCTVLAEKYFAVTSLIGSEQFYIQTKKSRQPAEHFENETLEMKSDVCTAVIRGTVFDHQGQSLFSMGPHEKAFHDELKQNNSISSSTKQIDDFMNSYKPHDIIVNGIILKEHVFLCLARNRESTSILKYFISPEYDVNESTEKGADKLMGRFVFANNRRNELVPIALAEESAHKLQFRPDSVEHIFQDKIAEEPEENDVEPTRSRTICKLTTFQKVRLCTVVLSAEEYRAEVKYTPDKDHFEPKCILKEIHFNHYQELHYDDEQYTEWWEPTRPVKAWMLACRALKIENNEFVFYYLAGGFTANELFIAKEVNGNVTVLDSISSKISVVPVNH